LIIANGSFYGTRKIIADAHIDDKTLIIFAMDSGSEWQGLKFWIGFLLVRHLAFPESRVFRAQSAFIETSPQKFVIMGGEKTTLTPMRLAVDPAAVRIMASESFRDHDDPTSPPGLPCPAPLIL
jgi:diacylglycerol kinase family enzyme